MKKFSEIKEKVVDFIDDHDEEIFNAIWAFDLILGGVVIGEMIHAKKIGKAAQGALDGSRAWIGTVGKDKNTLYRVKLEKID